MCDERRPPQTATSTSSTHDCQVPLSTAQIRAISTSAAPQATSTTDTRPTRVAHTVARVITSAAAARDRPATRSRSGTRTLPGQQQLLDVEVAGGEAGTRVLQVEVPHPQERVVEAERQDVVATGEEGLVPPAQRLGVVGPEGEPVGHGQRRVVGTHVVDD